MWKVHQQPVVWMCPILGETGVLGSCQSEKAASYTITDVTDLWGDPISRIAENGKESLTYNRSIAWRGVIIFLGLPIPLLIPVGHNKTTLIFENDHLVETTVEDGKESSAVCGIISEGPHGIGCKAGI